MTLLVGDPRRFAIEASPDPPIDGWILGRFRFWVGGASVGDWEGATDLKGCANWLREFATPNKDGRLAPALDDLDAAAAFAALHASAFGDEADPRKQPVPYALSRFNLDRLGMSSFDDYEIYMWVTSAGHERCLWRRTGDPSVHEMTLDPGEMERVAGEFAAAFEDSHRTSDP
jgi:hypothetical protein